MTPKGILNAISQPSFTKQYLSKPEDIHIGTLSWALIHENTVILEKILNLPICTESVLLQTQDNFFKFMRCLMLINHIKTLQVVINSNKLTTTLLKERNTQGNSILMMFYMRRNLAMIEMILNLDICTSEVLTLTNDNHINPPSNDMARHQSPQQKS